MQWVVQHFRQALCTFVHFCAVGCAVLQPGFVHFCAVLEQCSHCQVFKDRPRPQLSCLTVCDEDREWQAVKQLVGDTTKVSLEHDGADLFGAISLEEASERVQPLRVTLKALPDPLTLAKERYPNEHWEHSTMPTNVWLQAPLHVAAPFDCM